MRVYSYVIDHDLGFAPNPFHRVCSLAACKPQIRQHARLGDYVVGTGSKPSGGIGRIIYWMYVDEIIDFNQYWSDPRFRHKRPVMRGSLMLRYGDNIYHRDVDTGDIVQEDSFHSEPSGRVSEGNLRRDTGTTDRILLARKFAYWGAGGPTVPAQFADFVHRTQGHKCCFPLERAEAFADWLREQPARGCVGDPTDWKC
ncbi:MAG: hypothetical protein JO001_10770 [Alphaproteobacteria bacterium]|nr:hypothetical protein [Alphaproteobacteria bacterium]